MVLVNIDGWLQHMAAQGAGPGTLRLRRVQLAAFHRAAGEPTQHTVEQWLAQAPSPATRRSQYYALAGYCRWAGIPLDLRAPRVPPSARRACPDTVVAQALTHAPAHVADAIILARCAGLRAAEIAAARSDWWTPGQLWVVGKGGRSRIVPVGEKVDRVMAGRSGWVFPSPRGGHVTPGAVSRWLSDWLPGPWTGHSLRHAYATEFYEQSGHDLLWTADVLGHSSLNTTRVYLHGARRAGFVDRIGQHVA